MATNNSTPEITIRRAGQNYYIVACLADGTCWTRFASHSPRSALVRRRRQELEGITETQLRAEAARGLWTRTGR